MSPRASDWDDTQPEWVVGRHLGYVGHGLAPGPRDHLPHSVRRHHEEPSAESTGRPVVSRVGRGLMREWTPREDAMLGRISDVEVSSLTGRPLLGVRSRRLRLGIAAHAADRPFGWQRWTPEEDAVLGTAPDHVVAEALGRTTDAISMRRRYKGIDPYGVPPRDESVCEECGGAGRVLYVRHRVDGTPVRRLRCRECGARWSEEVMS